MKEWFTAADLAAAVLPGMPKSESAMIRLIKREQWQRRDAEQTAGRQGVWRRRKAAGGGVEYHLSLLPSRAQAALLARLAPRTPPDPPSNTPSVSVAETWAWFERQPEKTKARAAACLATLQAVDTMIRNGVKKDAAVPMVAAARGVATSSVWRWYSLVAGKDAADWLPALAPRYAGRTAAAECSPEAWECLKADYLRLEGPTFESCFARLQRAAAEHGWSIPSAATLRRRIEREIPAPVLVLTRQGPDALKRMYPAQQRRRDVFHALEAVNGDGHIFDVMVEWPDGEKRRPVWVVIQDVYSGKVLGWRVDKTENRDAIRLTIGDVITDHGIFEHIYFDNTRAFANKALTAGTSHRFRFKTRDEDPVGVLALLGIEVHFVTPYSGQSKPIERAFKDFADRVARHPAFAGAYLGNSTTTKPANYGERAVPLDEFLKVLAAEVIHHNARSGRRTGVCQGKLSFDQAFDSSYAKSLIRKATPEQARLWLMAAEGLRAHAEDGSIRLHGNRYWAEALLEHRGQPLVVRFDPQDLVAGIHVYDLAGRYLCAAECREAAGFNDVDAARAHQRARRAFMKATKVMADAERRLTAAEVAALDVDPEPPPPPEAKVVAGVFGNTARKAAPAPAYDQGQVLDAFARGLRVVRPESEI
jgi:hypothetical protein